MVAKDPDLERKTLIENKRKLNILMSNVIKEIILFKRIFSGKDPEKPGKTIYPANKPPPEEAYKALEDLSTSFQYCAQIANKLLADQKNYAEGKIKKDELNREKRQSLRQQ